MEKMICNRLYYKLENEKLFNDFQSGFRKNKRTLDHLLRISEDIRKALATKQYTLGVFLDIEKAYDMVWKKGVLFKLSKMGITGNTFNWINSFLHNRKLQVKVGNSLSNEFSVDNGVPQGSVISPLLFLIAINDLKVDTGTSLSLFADDTAIWKSNRNFKFLIDKIQSSLDSISQWCDLWGFKISIKKTQVIVFTRKKIPPVNLLYNNKKLPVVNKVKFLGLILDSKLSWKDHINFIIDKCRSRINLLKCISGYSWGASKETLCYIYKAFIRSRIDYASEIYNSACHSILSKLDIVQNKCLRICTGALMATPIQALEVDCGIMPLDLRRRKLQINMFSSYLASNNEIVKSCFLESWHAAYCKDKTGFVPFSTSVEDFIGNESIEYKTPDSPNFPFWKLSPLEIDISLSKVISKRDPSIINKILSLEFISNWSYLTNIFTDGSKSNLKCSGAFYIPKINLSQGFTLPLHCSNYDAELAAIIQALK